MENREYFWKLRRGKPKRTWKPKSRKHPRKVTRSPRLKDPFWRLTCAERAKFTKSKWKGSLGMRLDPAQSNCVMSAEFAQWLIQHNVRIRT